MNLKSLSNVSLESRLQKLVKTERKITHLILQCIAEIDRRKLYLKKAYPSLFEFLVQGYGYSPSAAMRRIDGARLLQEIPEVAEKIENGSVNLSQVSLIQRAEREIKRETQCRMPLNTKRELLSKIENKTQIQSEKLIATALNIDFTPLKKVVQHRDESVTLTITLSKEQMQTLETAQALLSHAVPEKNWASLITYLAERELSRRLGKQKLGTRFSHKEKGHNEGVEVKTKATKDCGAESHSAPSLEAETIAATSDIFTTATAVSKTVRNPIPQPIKKQVLHPGAACVYRHPQTGKVCGSRHFLQVDHIKSVSRGGGNELSNLQTLCGQHNRYKFLMETR
jgi:5-methylcytosine-specific restriction endonuclease McrA